RGSAGVSDDAGGLGECGRERKCFGAGAGSFRERHAGWKSGCERAWGGDACWGKIEDARWRCCGSSPPSAGTITRGDQEGRGRGGPVERAGSDGFAEPRDAAATAAGAGIRLARRHFGGRRPHADVHRQGRRGAEGKGPDERAEILRTGGSGDREVGEVSGTVRKAVASANWRVARKNRK